MTSDNKQAYDYEGSDQKVEIIPMKRVNGKLVKPEPWEAVYSQLFVDAERERYMGAINRQAEMIRLHLESIGSLAEGMNEIEKKLLLKEQECMSHALTVTQLSIRIEELESELNYVHEVNIHLAGNP